ncbi:MAG: NADH-quinone oxidoreductase subunit N [Pseudomonadota bacterium]
MILSNLESLNWFAPEIVITAGVLVVLLADLISGRGRRYLSFGLALLTLAGAAAALLLTGDSEPRGLFSGTLARDPFGDFWKALFLITTGLVAVLSLRSKETIDSADGDREVGELYALLLSVCLGMFLMAGATDLLVAYLALETVSILSFVLAGYKTRDRRSSEAALKYAIYGGVASAVMLYGLSLLYGMAASTSLAAIREAAVVNSSSTTLVIAITMVMAGFGYKIAAVPFHMWCPDVYEGAPTPITAFLSVGPKAAGFALLMRFFSGAVPIDLRGGIDLFGSNPWPVFLGIIAVATMTLGNLVAIVQQNVKRMLAYSSIAHAGYVLLGLTVQTPDGQQAMMFYLFVYLLMNVGAFTVVVALIEKGLGEKIDDFRGLGYRAPFIGVMMAVFLFSLTGLPPTAGFAGKFLLFAALIKQGGDLSVTLALIAVVNSAVSLYYYARILKAMFFDKPATESAAPVIIDRQHRIMLGALAAPILILGIFWGPLEAWAQQSFAMWSR